MRKLKLQVEELVVDSFVPGGSRRKVEGTVQGHQVLNPTSGEWTCGGNISCAYNCSAGCAYTHYETCEGPTCNRPDCVQTQ
jgi:hypothetical protein